MIRSQLARARQQVVDDLRSDPYLAYILLLAAVLMTFYIWHRLPNFATRDERWRVVDPMEVVSFYLRNPSIEGIREGIAFWRPYGATLYLYGIATLPVIGYAALTDQLDVFGAAPGWEQPDLFAQWLSIPAWVWTSSVLLSRLVNAALAVGCVYLVYRIGTYVRNRRTGRLAAVLMTLNWGLVVLAHEAGEDVPALFCFLVAVYFALLYLDSGSLTTYLEGCVAGGLAIAFKPSAGLGALVLGVAYFVRMRREIAATEARSPRRLPLVGTVDVPDRDQWARLVRPRLLVLGLATGLITIVLGYPSVFAEGPMALLVRIGRGVSSKGGLHGWLIRPTTWWVGRGFLNGLGWPLALASLAGLLAAATRLRERTAEADRVVVLLSGVLVLLVILAPWEYVRTHHLLLTFPLLSILVAVWLDRLRLERATAARLVTAGLLVTTALYTGVGTLGYASQPRDGATAWLDAHAGPNGTVETYASDPQEAAVPHRLTIYRPDHVVSEAGRPEWLQELEIRCPDYIALNYQRSYIWLAPNNHSDLASRWGGPGEAGYIHDLLAESGPYRTEAAPYPYEVAATFGPEPYYLDDGKPINWIWNAVRAGIYPRTIEYGDPQDMGVYQYVTILERTGTCSPS